MLQIRTGLVSPKIRIGIVEKLTLARQSLSALIDREPDLDVIWSAPTMGDAHECFRDEVPDVVVVDGDLPENSSIDLANRLKNGTGTCQIVVLAARVSAVRLQEALDADVSGYVLRDDSSDTILTAIREAVAGRRVWSPAVASRLRFDSASGRYKVSEGGLLPAANLPAVGNYRAPGDGATQKRLPAGCTSRQKQSAVMPTAS